MSAVETFSAFTIMDYGDDCQECGITKRHSELIDCEFCGLPICKGCEAEHYLVTCEHLSEICNDCGTELERDPPCPCCHANLCDSCFEPHVKKHRLWEYPQPKSQTKIDAYNFWRQW